MRHAVTISIESDEAPAFVQARVLIAVSREFLRGAECKGVPLEKLEAELSHVRDERDAYRDALYKAERRALT